MVALPQGVLISERGSTALIPELEGKSISDDPTLIMNKVTLSVHHGTLTQTYPGKSSLEESYVLVSKYNSTMLSAVLKHNRPGYHDIEGLIPDSKEEWIVLVTVAVQLVLLLPCCLGAVRFFRAVCTDTDPGEISTVESKGLLAGKEACIEAAPSAPPVLCLPRKETSNRRLDRARKYMMRP